ncbi:E3 ubiquitin-protein ligase TRIM56-like [Porites lutea]|uniref:E3 ubiquitin-protein ligase TRIM56-like n=1 Tax=Porites lutea TaxID=51062 RepID=UPI003CC6D391
MDIKTLLDNLHDEVSCSVCMCTFTDPKQLPCLHSFCLHCLNGIQRTSGVHGKITCPECRRQFQISGSGNPSELPTNFRINSLLDVLAIKECSTVNVKCRNCEKRSAQTLYCFQCCSFWCEECIVGHNIIRENKDHRTLALKYFQDQDIKAVLERPAFCQKKHHENKELELFCKDCKVAICSACAMTLHEGHGKMLLQEATDARKTQIKSTIKSLKDKALEKRKKVEKMNQKSIELQSKVADVKSQVQSFVDQIIAIIEASKQDVFDVIDNQAKKSLESLSHKKDEVDKQVKLIESSIEQTETLLKRNFSTEILGFSETFDTILREQSTQENRDTECIPQFSFTKSEKLINLLNMSEGIGNVEFVFNEPKEQKLGTESKESNKVVAGNKGANVCDSPFKAQVKTRRFRSVLSFGQKGESVGMFNNLRGVAVNDQDEIAVADCCNHRVSVFSSDGTHLRSFGRGGNNNGAFWYPSGIAFDSHGNIVVADCSNHRVQVFDRNGNFLSKFGEQGSRDNQLKFPDGLSINGKGDIIVADWGNKLIKIFSSSGEYLRKFGGEGSLVSPFHCIQHGQYFIVSDGGDHSIKMFDLGAKFISKFGEKGNKDGEFNKPRYLSVNKEGLLMVCDARNHRVQVFELCGKFVTKFGSKGSERGEFNFPRSTANLSDGRIVVCDKDNNRIQVFDKI